MAPRNRVLASHVEALNPDNISLVIDILSLAEGDLTLPELLNGLVRRLITVLEPQAAIGLIVDTNAEMPHLRDDGQPSLAELLELLGEPGSLIETAIISCPNGTRALSPPDVLRRLCSLDSRNCLMTSDTLVAQSAIVVLECPSLVADDTVRPQGALSQITSALFSRYQSARMQRDRVERVATISTILADIASDLDLDLVLATIVEQARSLIGTDAAYLAEVDESTGTVAMRVTVGIEDAGYKEATVEIGKGMAGAVAATGTILWTRDYLADDRFIHTRDTDANVGREGICGAIIAPLQVRDRVTGVLGVANHHATDFADDDLQLARSLADGAAIALENARLYAAQSQLVERMRALNALTSSQNERLQRSVQIHEQLAEIVLQGYGIEVIAQRLAALFANPVIVLGQFFNVLVAAEISHTEASESGAFWLRFLRSGWHAASTASAW